MGIVDYLRVLHEKRGSDLHLSPGNPPICRVSGNLLQLSQTPLTHEIIQGLMWEIMVEAQRDRFQKTGDYDFGYETPAVEARFRVNAFCGRLGMSAVFRRIPSEVMTAQQLNLPEVILKLTDYAKGLVLVTGATGTGKSTTLAAMIDHINRTRADHILTIEDPVEFVHKRHLALINQREVGVHTHSFAAALRAALREDPDVILVGEMRDIETMELALTAAETGHLVFGTLHTNTAPKAVDRILGSFPADQQPQIRMMLADSMRAAIAQNLVSTVDGKQAAAFEILVNTSAVSALIREGRTFQIPSSIQTGKADGMVTMDDSLRNLVRSGRVALNEAAKYGTSSFATGL
jgi:twitching motility protein PilT